MKFPEKMLLKLPAGTLDRIDAVCVNRSDWVRDLIFSSLDGGSVSDGPREEVISRREVSDPVDGTVLGGRWGSDKATVLGALNDGQRVVRRLADDLGWAQVRCDRIVGMLADEGRVVVSAGVVGLADG